MKNLSYLIEGELEKAEVVLAAKSMTDTLQKMAETISKMEAEDLMPLNDPIRDHFGPDVAKAFGEEVATKLRELTATLSDAKNTISDSIARMSGEQTAQSDLETMPDDALENDAGVDGDGLPELDLPTEDEATADAGADGDAAATDLPPEPNFGDEAMDRAAGRVRKESYQSAAKTLVESPDRALAREYAALVREGNTATEAAGIITETYGITIDTLIEVMEAQKR